MRFRVEISSTGALFRTHRGEGSMNRSRLLTIHFVMLLGLLPLSCVTERVTSEIRNPAPPKPQGFFGRLADAMTERECNVVRFTCPYGLGPADEPCECVDPEGVLRKGVTVK